jgi:glycine/D-amino acid oxidase-like deaminating enzyme
MAGDDRWDLECDVVIAGYGYAGAVAAMAAHDAGREVDIFEKTAHFGGNSILSGGSVVVARARLDRCSASLPARRQQRGMLHRRGGRRPQRGGGSALDRIGVRRAPCRQPA